MAGKVGYDYEFVEPPTCSFECSICLLTLRDPHVTSCCGHHFCEICISQVKGSQRPCPLCNSTDFCTMLHKGIQREVNGLIVYCQWKRLGCEWTGEIAKVKDHLEQDCGLSMVDCSYKCGAVLERRLVSEHEEEKCPKRPVEAQMSSLANKLSKRLSHLESKMELLLTERQSLSAELSGLKQETQALSQENKALKSELEAMKQSTVKTSPLPFYYTIHNFNHHRSTNVVLFSQPFYSHPGGYKLRLQVYPNGKSDGKGKCLSVFIGLMLGEFDEGLNWPFGGRVTMEIYNCPNKAWEEAPGFYLHPTASNRCTKRPLDCLANDSSGNTSWMSHDTLYKHYMIPGYDFVRIRVKEIKLINQ